MGTKPWMTTQNLEGYHKQEKWGSDPHWALPTLGICTGKMNPHNTWLWKLVELKSRRASGYNEIESPPLKSSC